MKDVILKAISTNLTSSHACEMANVLSTMGDYRNSFFSLIAQILLGQMSDLARFLKCCTVFLFRTKPNRTEPNFNFLETHQRNNHFLTSHYHRSHYFPRQSLSDLFNDVIVVGQMARFMSFVVSVITCGRNLS